MSEVMPCPPSPARLDTGEYTHNSSTPCSSHPVTDHRIPLSRLSVTSPPYNPTFCRPLNEHPPENQNLSILLQRFCHQLLSSCFRLLLPIVRRCTATVL